MSEATKQWIEAAAVRSIKTIAQVALSMLTIGQAVIDVNWVNVLSVSVVAGIISVLTSLAGLPEVEKEHEERYRKLAKIIFILTRNNFDCPCDSF